MIFYILFINKSIKIGLLAAFLEDSDRQLKFLGAIHHEWVGVKATLQSWGTGFSRPEGPWTQRDRW